MIKKIKKLAASYHLLPDKKRYAEFITAILSIPVLITVLLTNLNTLQTKDDKREEPEPKSSNIIISYVPQKEEAIAKPSEDPEACKKGIGNIAITTPSENEVITDDSVTIHIASDDEYCGVVWSYRINDGKWSEYDDNSVSLYNLKNGETRFELRVKSITNKEEKTLTRRFTYKGNEEILTPTATPSIE